MKKKIWSRKGRCDVCGVSTGSYHKKGCVYEYKLPEDSKMYPRQLRKVRLETLKKEIAKTKVEIEYYKMKIAKYKFKIAITKRKESTK